MPRKKKVPKSQNYYLIISPLLDGPVFYAAAYEGQAALIAQTKYKTGFIDPKNSKNNFVLIGTVQDFSYEKAVDRAKKTAKKITGCGTIINIIEKKPFNETGEKRCPECGCLDLSDGADICPNCDTKYPTSWYEVIVDEKHVRGDL